MIHGETPAESHDDAQSVQDRIVAALEREATPHMESAIDSLAKAVVAGRRGDLRAYQRHYETYLVQLGKFSHLTSNGMVVADYVGRMQTVMEARLSGALVPAVNASLPRDLPDYLKMPMTEAVQALAARNPVLAPSGRRVAEAYGRGEFALAKSTRITTTRRVQNELVKHIATGGTLENFTKAMKQSGFPESYAENVYRTNMAQAMTAGRVDQASDPDLGGFVVAWQWSATMDMATRPNHAKMDGFMAGVLSPVWRTFGIPMGFNCVLPGTLVQGAFVAGSKARYAGPAVHIDTAKGNRVSLTVNHPVLTGRGWVAAKDVREGDDLFSYSGEVEGLDGGDALHAVLGGASGRAINNQNMPARIEDVFDALAAQGVEVFVGSGNPLDFHGDAASFDGDVQIVRATGGLPDSEYSLHEYGVPEFPFVDTALPHPVYGESFDMLLAPGARSNDAAFSCAGARAGVFPCVSGGVPRRATLGGDNVRVGGIALADVPLELFRIGPAASLNASVFKNAADYGATDAILSSTGKCAHPGHIVGDDGCVSDGRCGDVPSLDSEPCDFSTKDITAANPGGLACVLDGLAPLVSRDRCVKTTLFRFSDHVYDLQSVSGWMVAGNIVISNCRCGISPITRPQAEAMGRLRPDGSFIDDPPRNTRPDPGFATGLSGGIYSGVMESLGQKVA